MRKKASNRVDMTGKIYNSWKVIEPDIEKSNGKALYWKSECLECNKIFSVWGANIRSGLSKRCTACGCGHGHNKQTGQIRTKRTSKESAEHYLLIRFRKDAKERKIIWNLSPKRAIQLIYDNCVYCGVEPGLKCFPLKHYGLSQTKTLEATLTRNGIDRIDSSKGYEEGNVVTCCETCNKAKLEMSVEDFKSWIIRVYTHMHSK